MTTKAIGYARVSTAKQADTGHSLEVQTSALQAAAERNGWSFEGLTEEGSGKSLARRPILQAALQQLAEGAASVLIVHRLDRLGRSLKDVLTIVEKADREGWTLIFTEQSIDSSTSAGRFTLSLFGAVAQFDNELRSERIREGLVQARANGKHLGRPLELAEATVRRIAAMRSEGLTLTAIADALNADGTATARAGGSWYPATVAKALKARGGAEAVLAN
jgi:DNA invertase Pin-like site-specific DNA recombinase